MNSCTVRQGILLLVLLLACSFYGLASAQTYRLRSFDGAAVSVRVYEQTTPRALVIACATDTVKVYDYWAHQQDEARIWNQQFLHLPYAVRGGSNVGIGNTLVLCVAQGKLCQALKAETFREYDLRNLAHIPGNPDEYELYWVRMRLLGTTPLTYQLQLTVHDERQSVRTPASNRRSTTQAVLKFDANRHLFYTAYQRVPLIFPVVDLKAGRVVTRKVTEPLPVIALNSRAQYFIQDEWYEAASTRKQRK